MVHLCVPLVCLIVLWLTIMPFGELIDNFTALKTEFGIQLRVYGNPESKAIDVGCQVIVLQN